MDIHDLMKYKNNRFIERWYEDQFPTNYRCSNCRDGILLFVSNEFHEHQTLESLKLKGHEDYCPEWERYIFSATLKCQKCYQHSIVTGTGSGVEDFDDETMSRVYYTLYCPKFFLPSIDIFKIPSQTPDKITKVIRSSFAIAFSDYSGAGNKLRVALELIVSDLVPNSKKTLGHKINAIDNDKAEIREMIKAIKWLGNIGSHEAKLEEYDLAFAFIVTSKVLNQLYPEPDDTEIIMKQVSMINATKGKIVK